MPHHMPHHTRRNPRLTAAGHERAPSVGLLSAFMNGWSRSDKACVGSSVSMSSAGSSVGSSVGSRASMSSRSSSASTVDELHGYASSTDELSQSVPLPRPPTVQCGETRPRGTKPGTPNRAKSWMRERIRKSSTEMGSQLKERVRRSSAEGGNSLLSWARGSISSPRRRRRSIAETPMEQAFIR